MNNTTARKKAIDLLRKYNKELFHKYQQNSCREYYKTLFKYQ